MPLDYDDGGHRPLLIDPERIHRQMARNQRVADRLGEVGDGL